MNFDCPALRSVMKKTNKKNPEKKSTSISTSICKTSQHPQSDTPLFYFAVIENWKQKYGMVGSQWSMSLSVQRKEL